jgi:hypothetical protein
MLNQTIQTNPLSQKIQTNPLSQKIQMILFHQHFQNFLQIQKKHMLNQTIQKIQQILKKYLRPHRLQSRPNHFLLLLFVQFEWPFR